ncbi:MAG: Gfo/Idh/MocA family oxidoreductase [Eubacterium sp.]|nr:Gfo/Idh/MocA family oxidoreductase [Eubacterium sp.]
MRVGIIGAGGIAEKMALTIQGLKDVENYAIASRSFEKAEAFKEKWAITKAYGSYEELLSDDKVDLVYIAVPHSHHHSCTMEALRAGKHVLCEKAFSVNEAQAVEMTKTAAEKKLLLAEAIWTRYMPSRTIIDDIIGSGEIGEVMSVDSNLGYAISMNDRMTNPALAGGCLLDLTVYTLNFSSMILGDDQKAVHASMVPTDTGVDGMDSVMIEYQNGAMATMFTTMYALTDRRGLITGEKGFIVVENINNPQKITVYEPDRDAPRVRKEIIVPEQITGYEYEVLACMDAIEAHKTECDAMPHAETLEIMRQMDAIRNTWGIIFPCE